MRIEGEAAHDEQVEADALHAADAQQREGAGADPHRLPQNFERQAVVSGLRGTNVRVEQRLDGALAVRYGEKYLPVTRCAPAEKKTPAVAAKPTGKRRQSRRGSDWNQNFDLKKAPKIWQVVQESGGRRGEAD